jgi:recombination protein RecA
MATKKKEPEGKPKKKTKATAKKPKTKTKAKTTTVKKSTTKSSKPLTAGEVKMKRALETIGKVFPKNNPTVNLNDDSFKRSLPHVSSGSITLDYAIGGKENVFGVQPCPGLPRGKIIQVYGHEGSGKTTLALEACEQVVMKGGSILYLDWENAIDPSYAKTLDVPVTEQYKFSLQQPDTLEAGLKLVWICATYGVDLIVIDSIGAGVPEAIFSQKVQDMGKDARIGLAASKWSQFLPKLQRAITKTGTAVMGIAQTRKAINTGGWGDPNIAQGGEAWKFYSALRIQLQRAGQLKAARYNRLLHTTEDKPVGLKVRAKLIKCKISSAQHSDALFYLRFGEGIDNMQSVIEIASSHGIIKKGGAWYTWERSDGDDIKGQGEDAFRNLLVQSGSYPELLKEVQDFLGESGETVEAVEEEDDADTILEDIESILTGDSSKDDDEEE